MRGRERNIQQSRGLVRNPGKGERNQKRRSDPAGRGEPQQMTGGRRERTASPDSSWHVMTIRNPRTHQRALTNLVYF